MALAGRVASLDERIVNAVRDRLALGTVFTTVQPDAARAAAHLAIGSNPLGAA